MKANDEMIEGFLDGYDLSAPQPSGNRSHSYRHGFNAGRNDKLPNEEKPFRGMRSDEILRLADEAMRKDAGNVSVPDQAPLVVGETIEKFEWTDNE